MLRMTRAFLVDLLKGAGIGGAVGACCPLGVLLLELVIVLFDANERANFSRDIATGNFVGDVFEFILLMLLMSIPAACIGALVAGILSARRIAVGSYRVKKGAKTEVLICVVLFLHRYPAILVGIIANVLIVGLCCQLALEEPPGAAIRPMGLAVGLFLIPLLATPLGVTLSILAIRERKNLGISFFGMVLSLIPFPLGVFAFRLIVDLMDYTLKP